MIWIQATNTLTASFLASLVECVEAATIVLAVGTVRGWRSALSGTGLAVAVLCTLVLLLGPGIALMPERSLSKRPKRIRSTFQHRQFRYAA
jgi:uncharacterized membrane protein